MRKDAPILVSGHRGMVGSAIVRRLEAGGYANVLTRTRAELDLLDQRAVHDDLAAARPDYVFIAAAKVGGIQANNTQRAEFLLPEPGHRGQPRSTPPTPPASIG